MKKKPLLIWLLLAVVLLISGGVGLALFMLNGDWLKTRLERKAAESGARLEIGDLEFAPFKGTAVMRDMHFVQNSEQRDLDTRVGRANLRLKLLPLLFKKVVIEEFTLEQPVIRIAERKEPRNAAGDWWEILKDKAEETVASTNDREGEEPALIPDFNISLLATRGGEFHYSSTREGEPPFRMVISDLDYQAREISNRSLLGLLIGSDISARIELQEEAQLRKMGSTTPATFLLSGLHLGSMDGYLNQSDALAVTAAARKSATN